MKCIHCEHGIFQETYHFLICENCQLYFLKEGKKVLGWRVGTRNHLDGIVPYNVVKKHLKTNKPQEIASLFFLAAVQGFQNYILINDLVVADHELNESGGPIH